MALANACAPNVYVFLAKLTVDRAVSQNVPVQP